MSLGKRGLPSPNGKRAAALRHRELLIVTARATGAGPETPVPEKRDIAIRLREGGCSLGDIGGLFGLSTESVRLLVEGKTSRVLTEDEWEVVRLLRRIEDTGSGAVAHRVIQQLRLAEQEASGPFLGLGA